MDTPTGPQILAASRIAWDQMLHSLPPEIETAMSGPVREAFLDVFVHGFGHGVMWGYEKALDIAEERVLKVLGGKQCPST